MSLRRRNQGNEKEARENGRGGGGATRRLLEKMGERTGGKRKL